MGCGIPYHFRDNPYGGYEVRGDEDSVGSCWKVTFSERRTLFLKDTICMKKTPPNYYVLGLHALLEDIQYEKNESHPCCFLQVGVTPSKYIKEYDKSPVPYMTPGKNCATWGLSLVRHPNPTEEEPLGVDYTSFLMGAEGEPVEMEGVKEGSKVFIDAIADGRIHFGINNHQSPFGIITDFKGDINLWITADAGCSFTLREFTGWYHTFKITKYLPAKPKANRKDIEEVMISPSQSKVFGLHEDI